MPKVALRVAGRLIWAALLLIALAVGLGPHTGWYRTLTVVSDSMEPHMRAGDVVVAVPKPLAEVAVGDVLVYEAPIEDRRVVTHRVIEIVEPGPQPVIRTQGDASPEPDPWTARLDAGPAWEARAVVPYAGWVVHTLRMSVLRWALVLVAPAILALMWLRAIWRPDATAGTAPA